ncbi:hypothetical protein Tcan_13088 [Toxocara canis]|uniref:Uncharacterized protein n=1 Tax=Toxocara canis TaxID=6265 RepID=A0A0B2UXS7_TOXCA|nr:hypothetical protein Tcan_13088 [Toxocara canis]
MACNPCCCWNVKDGVVTIGIWSMIFAVIQLALFSWQTYDIKYQRNLAANYLIPAFNTYGSYGSGPTYYENYYDSPLTRFYTGLFVIQILCLISSFFLLFASVALMYGAHTYSRYLIWPWFPCMIASILTSLAYCIMWWTGDVRSYWLILTILEIIVVLINLYCLTAVLIFYRQILADRDYYEANQRLDNYDQYPRMYDEYRKDNYYSNGEHAPDLNYSLPPGYQKSGQPSSPHRDEYRRLSDYNEEPPPAIRPKSQYPDQKEYHEDDMVSNWVKDQQTLGLIPDHANSEPTSPVREPFREPLQVILKTSTQGRRSRLPARLITAALETKTSFVVTWIALTKAIREGFLLLGHPQDIDTRTTIEITGETHHGGTRNENIVRRHLDRTHEDRTVRTLIPRSSRRNHFVIGIVVEAVSGTATKAHQLVKIRTNEEDVEGERNGNGIRIESALGDHANAGAPAIQPEQPPTTLNGQWQGPLSGTQGGITIPQHIIIPPSSGAVGKDGRIQPQTYQINSEIRILYDQYGRPLRPQTTVVGSRSEPASQQSPSPAQPSYSTNQRRPQVLSAAHLESDHRTRDRKPTPL